MMNQPSENLHEDDRLQRARRRRARRRLTQLQADEREQFLEGLAHLVSPSVGFFLRALLAGVLVGLGFRFDQRALLIAGVLVAPRMAPIAGMSLSAISGNLWFFLRMLVALLVGLVFFGAPAGFIGGWGIPAGQGSVLAAGHVDLNLIDFGLLVIGSIFFSGIFARQERIAALPSAAILYEVFLPAGVGAIGLVRSDPEMWQGAFTTMGMHLTWAIVIGLVVLFLLGFRPLTGSGHSLAVAVLLMGLLGILSALGLGASVMAAVPTPTPTPTMTATATATATATQTSTSTSTATSTATYTVTATVTNTATPTPPSGIIFRTGGQGAILRDQPSGDPIGYLAEGQQVQVIDGPILEFREGKNWWQIRTEDGLVGWVVQDFVATITPSPSPTP